MRYDFVYEGSLSWQKSLSIVTVRVTCIDKKVVSSLIGDERIEAISWLEGDSRDWAFPPSSIVDLHEGDDILLEFGSPYHISFKSQNDMFLFLLQFSEYLETLFFLEAHICFESFLRTQKMLVEQIEYSNLLKQTIMYDEDFVLRQLLPTEHTAGAIVSY